MKSVNFTQMKDGTKEEYLFLRDFELEHNKGAASAEGTRASGGGNPSGL
jgi:hypothetical protein